MPKIVRSGCHVAALDIVTGCGVLARPDPAGDIPAPPVVDHAAERACGIEGARSALSLHEADYGDIMRQLVALGWEPNDDDDGIPVYVTTLPDGREVVALIHDDPIMPALDLDDAERWHEAERDLLAALADLPT